LANNAFEPREVEMPKMSEEQQAFFENARNMAKAKIDELRMEIERELAAVKERITKLNAEMRPLRQIYEGACQLLGLEGELESEEAAPEESEAESEAAPAVEDDYGLDDELIEVDEDEELEY